MFGRKVNTRVEVHHGKEETGTPGGGCKRSTKGIYSDVCNLSMEIRMLLTTPHIYPVSARTQGRDCKDNEYNHISWSQNI